MKKLFNIALLVTALSCLPSCTFVKFNFNGQNSISGSVIGSDTTSTMAYPVADFTSLESRVAANITYHESDSISSVVITAPSNFFDYITCDVENGHLLIATKDNKRLNTRSNDTIAMDIYSSTLNDFDIKGACKLNIPDGIETDLFSFHVQGAADADLQNLKCDNVSLTIQGAASLDLKGLKAGTVDCLIQGAGSVTMEGVADTARITVQGAGRVDVDNLDAKLIESNLKGIASESRGSQN